MYHSDDDGAHWADLGSGLPSTSGFAAAAHPRHGDTAYVLPIEADTDRVPAGHRCRVFRTTDAGTSGEPLVAGLPRADPYGTVLRDALCTDDADRPGCPSATATARCTPRRTTVTAGSSRPRTCRTSCASARR